MTKPIVDIQENTITIRFKTLGKGGSHFTIEMDDHVLGVRGVWLDMSGDESEDSIHVTPVDKNAVIIFL